MYSPVNTAIVIIIIKSPFKYELLANFLKVIVSKVNTIIYKTKYIPYLYILAFSTMHRYSIYIIDITIPYTFNLDRFDMGLGKQSQELDILFVEKCIKAIDSSVGGEIYTILPEGLLNLPYYLEFREWLLRKCYLTIVVSLPEGAFIPFGKSVSKTTILGLRKKGDKSPPG